ncbi:MAG: hypothetical protein HC908_03475 [Calothrix sp. SM1_7_51]|nr:hypothetical protein [Calothrix sp. SM1_7_51]
MSEIDRDVLLIRLANELEEYLDNGMLYCGASKQTLYSNHAYNLVIEMAEKLGHNSLADEFKKSYERKFTSSNSY